MHHGVGERKQTPFPARLEFTSDGLGVLTPTQDDRDVMPVWVNDVLALSLHMAQRDGQGQLVIWDSDKKGASWRSGLVGQRKAKVLALEPLGAGGFVGEVYLFTLSPCGGVGPRVFLTVPYLQDYIFKGKKHNKWIARYVPTLSLKVNDMGFEGSKHIVMSAKCLQAKASVKAEALPAEVLANAGQEYACSAIATLVLLMHLACTNKQVSSDNKSAAKRLLVNFVNRFVNVEDFVIHCRVPGQGIDVFVSEGTCSLHPPSDPLVPVAKLLKLTWMRSFAGPLAELLLLVRSVAFKRTIAGNQKAMAHAIVLEILKAVSNLVEHTVDSSNWDSMGHLELPILRLSSARARRVPQGFKRSAADVASSTKGVKRISQLIAGARAFAGKRNLVSVRAAANFVQDNQLLYLATCQRTLQHEKHFSVSLDGVRSSGEEILVMALYAPGLQRACWLPPQAGHSCNYFGGKFDRILASEFSEGTV